MCNRPLVSAGNSQQLAIKQQKNQKTNQRGYWCIKGFKGDGKFGCMEQQIAPSWSSVCAKHLKQPSSLCSARIFSLCAKIFASWRHAAAQIRTIKWNVTTNQWRSAVWGWDKTFPWKIANVNFVAKLKEKTASYRNMQGLIVWRHCLFVQRTHWRAPRVLQSIINSRTRGLYHFSPGNLIPFAVPECHSQCRTSLLHNSMCVPACVKGSLECKRHLNRCRCRSSRILSREASSKARMSLSPLGTPRCAATGFYLFVSGGRVSSEGLRNSAYFWEPAVLWVGIVVAVTVGFSTLWKLLGQVVCSHSGVPASCFSSAGVTTNEKTEQMGQSSGVMDQGSGRRTEK